MNEKELLQGELVEAVRRYEDVFEVLDTFKADLLKEMREGMRNEVREEIVGEVKKSLKKCYSNCRNGGVGRGIYL